MKDFKKAVRFMTGMMISCVIAVFVGMWLDKLLHTEPWIFLLLLLYAIAGNLYLLMKGLNIDE